MSAVACLEAVTAFAIAAPQMSALQVSDGTLRLCSQLLHPTAQQQQQQQQQELEMESCTCMAALQLDSCPVQSPDKGRLRAGHEGCRV